MIRRLTTVIAATGLAAAGLTATAPTATAAGSCSAYIPSRVAVGQPYRAITIRAGSNCSTAQMDWAAWFAYHPTQGLQEVAFFEHPSYSDTWHMYSASAYTPIGRWQWRPEGAYDRSSEPIYQYGPYYTDVRLASYGRVTATRIGSRVNLRTSAYRYWGDGAKFIGWASARGQIQYRSPGTSTWRALKEVYSYPNGTYSYTYTTSAARYYRVVFYDASNKTIWGSTSPQVYR
jgi:hypothetical protein